MTAIGWILDQATKNLAVAKLADGRVVELFGPLYLELTFNPHAAFGIRVPWWGFPLVTLLLVGLVVWHLPRSQTLIEPFAYGLLMAGALGNMTDRLRRPHPDGIGRGEVVDFIASTFWPTFNVADMCITIGFILLVVAAIVQYVRTGAPDRAERAAAETG
jgi:signal peptidase II